MNKHTEGSWKCALREEDASGDIAIVAHGSLIANVTGPHDKAENALLIAAAPDLLACCKLWLAFYDRLTRDDEPGDPLAEARRKVHGSRAEATRAAIAKAEGRS